MAKFTAQAEAIVTMNGKEAESVLSTLKERAKSFRKELEDIKKIDPNNPNIPKMEKQLKALESSTRKVTQTTYDYQKVLKNLNGSSLHELQKAKKTLLNQIKQMKQGTEEYINKTKQLQQVDGRIQRINKSMKEQQSVLGSVFGIFQKIWAGIDLGIRAFGMINQQIQKLTGYFKDWEKSFTNVLTLMSDADISKFGKEMEKGAIEVMKNYGLTIEDTNKSLFDAVSAGIPAGEAIKFLNEAAKLAVGGVTSLSVSVDGLTSIIKAYSLEITDTNKVASAFFTAQKYGKTTVADLASGIGKVAPIARQAGVSFQELLSATAELTLRGISTDEAFTALRGAFTALLKPGKQAEEVLRSFGVPVGATEVRAAGLGNTLSALNKIILENPDAISKAIPNIRGFMAVTALSGEALEHYGAILKDVNEDFGETSYLTKAVGMQQETLAQRMARAKAEFVAFVLQNEKLRSILSSLILSTNKFLKLLFAIPGEVYLAVAAFGATVVVLKSLNLAIAAGRSVWTAYNKILLLVITGFHRMTGNVQKATIAWRAFNIGFSKTTFGVIIAGLTAITLGLIALFSSTNEATKAFKEFYAELEKEKRNAAKLVEEIEKANAGTEVRKKLIQEFNSKYGEYLGYQLEETANTNDLTTALTNLNAAMEKQMALKFKNQADEEIFDEHFEKQIEALNDIAEDVAKKYDASIAKRFQEELKKLMEDNAKEIFATLNSTYYFQDANKNAAAGGIFRDLIELFKESELHLYSYRSELMKFTGNYLDMNKKLAENERKFSPYTGNSEGKETGKATETREAQNPSAPTAEEMKKQFEEELQAVEDNRRKMKAAYVKRYEDGIDDREKFNQKMESLEEILLYELLRIHVKYGENTQDIEDRILEMRIKKADAKNKNSKSAFDADIENLENYYSELKKTEAKNYMSGLLTREQYNEKLESLENLKLIQRLIIYKKYEKDTKDIEDKLLAYQIKQHEKIVDLGKKALAEIDKQNKKNEDDANNEVEAELNKKLEEAEKIKAELRAGNIAAMMEAELTAIEELHNLGLLSEEEYENKKLLIRLEAAKKYIAQFQMLQQTASDFVGSLQDAETSKVEAEGQKQLSSLQQRREQGLISEEEYNAQKQKLEDETAQKKLDVEKKFADVNFAIRVAEIGANAAMGIANAWAAAPSEGLIHGPILAAILTGVIAGTAVAQIAAANSERQKVKAMTLDSSSGGSSSTQQRVVLPGIEEGGFINVEREQDGKLFRAKKRKQRGYVDEPSVLTGEAGAEFVANADAVANPTIKPVLDLIDIAQRTGSVSSINFPKFLSTYTMQGMASGGYTSENASVSAAVIQPVREDKTNNEMLLLMKDVRGLLVSLINEGVKAPVVLSELQKQQELLKKSEQLGSRK
jgi:TP901 family phage tail tape measure protein